MIIISERRHVASGVHYQRYLMQALLDVCERANISREKAHPALLTCIRNFKSRFSETQQALYGPALIAEMLEVCAGLGIETGRMWQELAEWGPWTRENEALIKSSELWGKRAAQSPTIPVMNNKDFLSFSVKRL